MGEGLGEIFKDTNNQAGSFEFLTCHITNEIHNAWKQNSPHLWMSPKVSMSSLAHSIMN